MPPAGGDKRNRTADPLLAKQVLSQLSYTPSSSQTSLISFPLLAKTPYRSVAPPLKTESASLGFGFVFGS